MKFFGFLTILAAVIATIILAVGMKTAQSACTCPSKLIVTPPPKPASAGFFSSSNFSAHWLFQLIYK